VHVLVIPKGKYVLHRRFQAQRRVRMKSPASGAPCARWRRAWAWSPMAIAMLMDMGMRSRPGSAAFSCGVSVAGAPWGA
jgi:rhamnogalacturonyl hydrolase YesR